MKLKVFMGQSLGMVPFGSYSKFAGKLWMFNDVHPPNYGIMSFNPYHIQIIYIYVCIYNTLCYVIL